MESVREYLVSVTCAAVLCGILSSLADEKQTGGMLLKLLCGIFLSLTLIQPLSGIRLEKLDLGDWKLTQEGQAAADAGLEYAKQAKIQIIKERTEAYILDKAARYGLDLTVEVRVSEEETPVPEAVVLLGRVSPYTKAQLQRMIETELSIPKENQQWTESDSS